MVIRLPDFVLQHALYYEKDVFKKAMRLQVGLQFRYITGIYSDAYMPATSQFFLQNNRKVGDYPYVDFFINARIKMVRIFLKVDHLNAGLSGTGYSNTPGYPWNGRAFKLGVSWRFYD
jgi:hypothetical protein